jgi:hypothetical protein
MTEFDTGIVFTQKDLSENLLISEIVNPNIEIYSDGTKIRRNKYNAEFPESIDLKITNKCYKNCPFCHEESGPDGIFFCVDDAIKLLRHAPWPTEVAIGGGDPSLCCDEINYMVRKLPNCIINVTLNYDKIREMDKIKANAFGLSLGNRYFIDDEVDILLEYTKKYDIVLHIIAGLTYSNEIYGLSGIFKKILVLGYKEYGRGGEYFSRYTTEINTRMRELRENIVYMFKCIKETDDKFVLAFDNLAIDQLGILSKFYDQNDRCYMGHDGEYSMYIDLVDKKFGVNSTSSKIDIGNKSLYDMFGEIKNALQN